MQFQTIKINLFFIFRGSGGGRKENKGENYKICL